MRQTGTIRENSSAKRRSVDWTPGAIPSAVSRTGPRLSFSAEAAISGLFVIAMMLMLEWAAYIVIPVFASLVVGLTFGPVIDRMGRAGLSPYLSGLILLSGIGAAIYMLFLTFAIPLEEWSSRIPEVMNRIREVVFWIKDPLDRLHEISREVQNAANGGNAELEVSVRNQGVVTSFLASAPAVLGQLVIFVGAFYFFLATRRGVKSGLLALAAGPAGRLRVARMVRDAEHSLSRYLLAITAVNTGLGIATGLTMWALGMPSPALWGALATVLNFIPFLGPAMILVILLGIALISFETALGILMPPAAFLALNILESQFITPAVLGSRLVLNPLLVFLSIAFWLWLWGPVGAFLAVPLLILGATALYHSLPAERRANFSFGMGMRGKETAWTPSRQPG